MTNINVETKSDYPLVSVLIPTKNRGKEITTMLDSLLKQSYKKIEVIIVDGYSTDNTIEVVEGYKDKIDIRVFKKKGGLVKQVNCGLKELNGEIFIRTDDDAEYTKDTIKEIVRTFQLSDDIGGVSGPTITPDKNTRDLFLFQEKFKKGGLFWRLVGNFYFNYIFEGKIDKIGEITSSGVATLGANLPYALKLKSSVEMVQHECITYAVRTDLLRKIGGFDEIFSTVGDYHEIDASFRLRDLGYKIMLNPAAYAYHHTSKDGVYSARNGSFWRIVNFINFYFRHIKPNTFRKFFHFFAYLFFQNAYYTYMFIKQRKLVLLGCYFGSIYGILINFFKVSSWRGGLKTN